MSLKNSIFNELREQQQFCDVVIGVGDQEFHAHKIMLSNCSPYFRALLTRWLKPDCHFVQVSDVSPHIMNLIIEYAYTDSPNATEKNVQELFIAADRFSIMGIVQVCRELLEQLLSPQNCIDIMRFGDMYYQLDLKRKAFLFLMAHFEEVATSGDFKTLSTPEIMEIVKNDLINVREETIVLEAIMDWIQYDPERQRYLSFLLSKVRLAYVSADYITQTLCENPLVKTNESCQRILRHTLKVIQDLMTHPLSNPLFWSPVARPRLPSVTLLAFGGWTGLSFGGFTNTIEAYDVRARIWVNVVTDNSTPRAYHGCIFLNGFVYCVGGSDGTEQLSSMERFDLEKHSWQEVAPMHSRRGLVSATLLDGCIYAIGGFDGHNQLNSAEIYRPESNQWTEIPPMHDKRSYASCVAVNGKVYIFGGFNGWQYLTSAECYDPRTKDWTRIADMERGRSGLGVAAYANRIFAVGGYIGHARTKSVEAYDPDNDTWSRETPMVVSRSNFGITVMDGRLFVIGGDSNFRVMKSVECYDARTTQWSNVRDLCVPRSALSCCVVHSISNMADYAAPRNSLE